MTETAKIQYRSFNYKKKEILMVYTIRITMIINIKGEF